MSEGYAVAGGTRTLPEAPDKTAVHENAAWGPLIDTRVLASLLQEARNVAVFKKQNDFFHTTSMCVSVSGYMIWSI
jgi:hypothetical protein